MKEKTKLYKLFSIMLCLIMLVGLLPTVAVAASLPDALYASITPNGFGKISQGASTLTYATTGTNPNRVIYGMESAGGVFFIVEGKVLSGGKGDDGWRELRMYNSSLNNYRTIGTVNQAEGDYWIVDTAMNTSGEAPELYGTYNFVFAEYNRAQSMICTINLETAAPGNFLPVSGLPAMHIIYAIAFDKNGTMYAIGADAGDNGGPASLYTIDLQSGAATLVGAIKNVNNASISTNYCQDIAFDPATNTLYWAENNGQKLYAVNTETAVATEVGPVKYAGQAQPLQNFCFYNNNALANGKYMISVFCEGEGTVTSDGASKPFYMVTDSDDITLAITASDGGKVTGVKDNDEAVAIDEGETNIDYPLPTVQSNHMIEVNFQKAPSIEKNTWVSRYEGECYTAAHYTKNASKNFYKLKSAPSDGYTQTLLDTEGTPIADNTIIYPGDYDVRITHPGNDEYMPLDVIYEDALQLAKMNGTPGRPVVYGRIGCKQSELPTTSYIQDWYGDDGELINAAYDQIPVKLVWQEPEKVYTEAGIFSEDPVIYAADELDERLVKCYDIDRSGTPLTAGCKIDQRSSQVVILDDDTQLHSVTITAGAGMSTTGNATQTSLSGAMEDVTYTATDGYYFPTDYSVPKTNGISVTRIDYTQIKVSGIPTADTTITLPPATKKVKEAKPECTVNAIDENRVIIGNFAYRYYYSIDSGANWTKFNTNYIAGVTPEHGVWIKDKTDYPDVALDSDIQKITMTKAAKPTAVVNDTKTKLTGLIANGKYIVVVDGETENLTADASGEHFIMNAWFGESIMLKKGGGNELHSEAQTIEINSRPAMPETTIDYINEKMVFDVADEWHDVIDAPYSFRKITSEPEFPINDNCFGKTIKITRYTARDANNIRSEEQILNIPQRPEAPTDIAATNATSSGATNGKINNVADTMEYKKQSETAWKTITGTEIENLSPAVYEIRYKATETAFASKTVNITVGYRTSFGGGRSVSKFTVKFETNGGSAISNASVVKNSSVKQPTAPTKEGFKFDGWYTDKECTKAYAFASKVTSGITLYAKWVEEETTEPIEPTSPVTGEWKNPFGDVETSDWYYEAVKYVNENKLMNGAYTDAFSPNATLTRGMLVTILYRLEGEPDISNEILGYPFADVHSDSWYTDAVYWARKNGIVNGVSETSFAPDNNITREQIAAILYRYAVYKGMEAVTTEENLGFADKDNISEYAISSMNWAVGAGLIKGKTESTVNPLDNATRAEIATILQRFIESNK